jgi:diaminopimelate decarboxylase
MLTPEQLAQKKVWLAEAELALHRLRTGTAEQTVNFGAGKGVTYTAASADKLEAYIARLQAEIAAADPSVTAPAKRGPIRFDFG